MILSLSLASNHFSRQARAWGAEPGLGCGVLGAEAGKSVFRVSSGCRRDLGDMGGVTCSGAPDVKLKGNVLDGSLSPLSLFPPAPSCSKGLRGGPKAMKMWTYVRQQRSSQGRLEKP